MNLLKARFVCEPVLRILLKGENFDLDSFLDEITEESISTQYYDKENNCKPDLFILTKDFKLYLESKIHTWTGIQNSQKITNGKCQYIDSLNKKGQSRKKILIYLIPDNYQHLEEIRKVEKKFENSNTFIVISSW